MENVYESYSETVYDRRYRIIERGCTTDYNPNLKQVRSSMAYLANVFLTNFQDLILQMKSGDHTNPKHTP